MTSGRWPGGRNSRTSGVWKRGCVRSRTGCPSQSGRRAPDKLPAPLAHVANAPNGRYVLACRVAFAHRGEQWADRVQANRAVAYRIHEDTTRGRWYLTAAWKTPVVKSVPLSAARTNGLVGVDTNADHLAAWRLDTRQPRRHTPPLRLQPVRHRRPPRRSDPPRPDPPAALGQTPPPRHRDRRPRLHRRSPARSTAAASSSAS
jgi:hypothetical protein